MSSVLVYHVVGDLTVGKPELVEFLETETVESAIQAIAELSEGGIPVWRTKDWCLQDQEKAMKTPVSEVIAPNNSLLKEVDPATRLVDALEMMKQGVKRLLVPKSVVWKGVSKKFSILYNGKWLRTIETGSNTNTLANLNCPSSSSTTTNISKTTYCCLSREDVIRFLIGCLGALVPIPLSSISSLKAINPHYSSIEAPFPAVEATTKVPHDPSAVAVVEPTSDGQLKIIGEISACKLWKCDYLAAAYALANLSAGQFVMGVEDNISPRLVPDIRLNSRDNNTSNGSVGPMRLRRFSSRSLGFFGSAISPNSGSSRSMYRGRSAPLTCKETSSLAAVMAQMLSHRATHVWVTEGEDDVLVGVVGYGEIMHAVTNNPPSTTTPSNP